MTYPLPPGPGDQGQPPPDPLYQPPVEAYQPPPPDQPYPPLPGHAYFPSNPAYPTQAPPYWAPDQAYPAPAYQTGYGYGGYPPYRPTDGLAVASLVVSCIAVPGLCGYGILGLIAGVVGAILGHVGRRRIARTGASGAGMALAGIIVGWIAAAIGAVLIVLFILLIVHDEWT